MRLLETRKMLATSLHHVSAEERLLFDIVIVILKGKVMLGMMPVVMAAMMLMVAMGLKLLHYLKVWMTVVLMVLARVVAVMWMFEIRLKLLINCKFWALMVVLMVPMVTMVFVVVMRVTGMVQLFNIV